MSTSQDAGRLDWLLGLMACMSSLWSMHTHLRRWINCESSGVSAAIICQLQRQVVHPMSGKKKLKQKVVQVLLVESPASPDCFTSHCRSKSSDSASIKLQNPKTELVAESLRRALLNMGCILW